MRTTAALLVALALTAAACSDEKRGDGLTDINGPAVVETTTTVAADVATTVADDTSPPPTEVPESTTPASETSTTTASAIGPYTSAVYSDPTKWLCRGDAVDLCDEPQPVTEVAADGTMTQRPYTVAKDPPLDCFYVYPTISTDETFNSDFDVSNGAEAVATQRQVASFNQLCTIYAPIYRSVTLAGLFGQTQGDFASGWRMAYEDVLDAWKSYLANDNHGRPVVLVAHSQGSFHASTLLQEEIDPNPAERALVVSAIIPGTSFQVAPGQDVGGTTQNMPLCRSNDQFGCVITYQTFPAAEPPHDGSFFGRPGATTDSACTNPAALAGGSAVLSTSIPAGDWVLAQPGASVTTPFVDLPGLISGECAVNEGYRYLAITLDADPNDPRADQLAEVPRDNWGLHSIDLNLAMGDLLAVVEAQTAAYIAAQ